ncbi:unnamed protein product [Rotaria magnacalcarata]|uniref:G-protein coupled receptors family 1 profile domain-containing protein n=1 Tax=Rotaria magnacalcarata TaxID=392030 RepID=A0A816XC87_9BILA|nr:unnamed protein product [Rotaria magnacalcarata]CAF1597155.1 unnamed protein product [Rotaria magnacalcarata]CAF2025448.1 unnamed protein product [Rotaria magnacalcarata]CAF2138070.1 unnamed protein product [Rotaria magnacalcarata]CAF2144525.1 unnamed protein product [Rotaria magnacalcarata]
MILIQVIYTAFSIFPSLVVYMILLYGSIQDLVIVAGLRIAYALMACLYSSYFANPFYIYVCASERFRRQLFHVISKGCLKRLQRRVDIIYPVVVSS